MKKLFIVGNWKSNKTTEETKEWLQAVSLLQLPVSSETEKETIVCLPYTLLPTVKSFVEEKQLALKLGVEDFSAFDAGAHTGEEPPELLKEYIQYAIIGHSERRNDLAETDELIAKKIAAAQKYNITPILCVQGKETPVPDGVTIVAYEPIFAIGTGHPATPENAEEVAKFIKEKHGVPYVLYGGSVTPEDVHGFTELSSIDGVLVGGASLDAEKFVKLIEAA